MWKEYVFSMVFAAVTLVGITCTMYQIYKMTILDAKSRGLKHPKFWAFFSMNGNNSSGLLLYLIGRRKYPIISMSQANQKEIATRKKKIGLGLIFLVVGSIGFISCIFLL